MSADPVNFRSWLRDQLVIDAGEDAVLAAPLRRIHLSDLEALALVILCIDQQTDSSVDRCTIDIARLLAGTLLARLA